MFRRANMMRRIRFLSASCALLLSAVMPAAAGGGSTLTLVARDPATGDCGVAVVSSIPAAGGIIPAARAGAGAVAAAGLQPAPSSASRFLDLLAQGMAPAQASTIVAAGDSAWQRRQFAVVDAQGNVFGSTEKGCTAYAGHTTGSGYCAAGDGLAGAGTLTAAARMFEVTPGDIADRLLAALDAGERAGATVAPLRSAAIIVVRAGGGYGGSGDRFIDLRVDDDSLPLAALTRIYGKWKGESLPDARMRSIDAFNAAGNFSAARSETERMVAEFNNELRLRPDDAGLMARIARVLAAHDIDKIRALELAKRAATLSPGSGDILDALAECHFALGHTDEAIAIETSLVAKEPANDDFWKHLQRYKEGRR